MDRSHWRKDNWWWTDFLNKLINLVGFLWKTFTVDARNVRSSCTCPNKLVLINCNEIWTNCKGFGRGSFTMRESSTLRNYCVGFICHCLLYHKFSDVLDLVHMLITYKMHNSFPILIGPTFVLYLDILRIFHVLLVIEILAGYLLFPNAF